MGTKTIEQELLAATGAKPQKKGEDRQAFLKRIHEGVQNDVSDDDWKNLSSPAGKWSNDASKAFDADQPFPDFPDVAAVADKPVPKGKGKAAPAAPADEDPGEAADETETTGEEEAEAPVAEPEDTVKKPAKKKAAAAVKPAKTPKADVPKASAKDKPAAKKAPAKKAAAASGEGYKGHRAGSRKETVHKVFDDKGRDAAIKKAADLGIQENTAKGWLYSWGSKAADTAKPAKKPAKAKK